MKKFFCSVLVVLAFLVIPAAGWANGGVGTVDYIYVSDPALDPIAPTNDFAYVVAEVGGVFGYYKGNSTPIVDILENAFQHRGVVSANINEFGLIQAVWEIK
jgi:hypothetical protein